MKAKTQIRTMLWGEFGLPLIDGKYLMSLKSDLRAKIVHAVWRKSMDILYKVGEIKVKDWIREG